jgi:phage baseplate assembly protein W
MITNNRYIDVNLDFERNSFNNDVSKSLDLNSIQQSVIKIVSTSKNEKPFDSDFGVGIYDLIFENIQPEDIGNLASEIDRQLKKYEPRVIFSEVRINQNTFTLEVEVDYIAKIKYSGQPPLQTIKLTLTKVR